MIELKQDALIFSFPDVHRDAVLRVTCQRTLRVPRDDRDYRLRDLGCLPLRRAVPRAGDAFVLPLRVAEALWLSFSTPWKFPFAVKVTCGGIDALTGGAPRAGLHRDPQDYVPVPAQTWLDGCRCGADSARQITVETSLRRGDACGLRITVHPAKASVHARSREESSEGAGVASPVCYAGSVETGPSPGARLHEDVLDDTLAPLDWDVTRMEECCIARVSEAEWRSLTGTTLPAVTAPADYARAGIPWLEQYDHDAEDDGAPG